MYKLFVADCAPSVFEALRSALPETEFEIVSFSDGTEVIKALELEKPDAVLLNLFLEAKDGYDICFFINSRERFSKIPLFLLKGAFEPVDEKRLSDLNYREMIEEPFDSQHLAQKIRTAVEGGDEPLVLPEEPVPEGETNLSKTSDRELRDWINQKLERSEVRIRESVRQQIFKDVKKYIGAKGFFPSEDEGKREEKD